MKRILVSVLAAFVLLQSCKTGSKKALQFSEDLTAITTNIYNQGKEMGVELGNAVSTRDFSKLSTQYKNLSKFVDESIETVKKKEDVAGSETFRKEMISFLEFEKELIDQGFEPFLKMDANTTQEEIQAAAQNLQEKAQEEGTHLAKVRAAQKAYADKNGFQIKDKKP